MANSCSISTMTLGNQNQNNFYLMTGQQPAAQQTQYKIHHQSSSPTTVSTNLNLHKVQAIAPAPSAADIGGASTIDANTNVKYENQQLPIDTVRGYKKKYTYANAPFGELPQSVARRNARERNRVKQVNNGFATLRQHIPQNVVAALTNGGRGASKKLSKVDTLRMAVEYISRLQELISDSESDSDSSSNYNSAVSSAGSPTSQYFPASSETSQLQNQHHHYHGFTMRSPSYSEASVSPTPSYSSDQSIGSTGSSTQYYNIQPTTTIPATNQQQLKFEPFDTYGSITDTTAEDEELLDYISSWQEQ